MQVPRQGWSQWPQAQVVHQVMPQNNQMTMQNVHRPSAQMGGAGAGSHAPHPQAHAQAQAAHTAPAAHAAPFPALPVNLSRQHLPDREPGSFTPPAAGVGSFVPRMGESTPTSRAKSPEVIQAQAAQAIGPHGMMMPRGGLVKSPPRMPGPKSSLGALPGSARNTPKPQSRQVVSFAPMGRSPSPNRQAQDRSPSPESRQIRDGDRCDRRRETWQDRDRRLSRSEDSIPEEPPRVDQDRLADRDRVAKLERDLLILQEKLRVREHKVAEREADLVAREKRVADREADLAKMFDRLTEREEHHRQDSQVRANDLASQKDELQAEALQLKNRCADLDCRSADLDQREVKLKAEEDRCKELKRNLDERDARWHEAAKDATVILKPHLKPRLSPRGKENMELQRQLEEQRGLMHKIKRKQDSWAESGEEIRCHRDSFGSEETVSGHC